MKKLKKILVSLLLAVITIIVLLLILGFQAKLRLSGTVPPPGRLIDIGGYKLHLNCKGENGPVVFFEAGSSEFSVQWDEIQREISKNAIACSYDRAGLGWSDLSPNPRTSDNIIKELHALIKASNLQGPYILVGHSFGGLYMRLYSYEYPGEVAGLVLIDPASENLDKIINGYSKGIVELKKLFSYLGFANKLGLLAVAPDKLPDRGLKGDALEKYRYILATTNYFTGATAEIDSLQLNLEKGRSVGPREIKVPLIVISRSLPEPIAGLTDEENKTYEIEWANLHSQTAKLSTDSAHIKADKSGHYIHLTQPDLVIKEINQMIQKIQANPGRSN